MFNVWILLSWNPENPRNNYINSFNSFSLLHHREVELMMEPNDLINCSTFPLIKLSWHPDLVLRLLREAAQLSKFQLDTRNFSQRAVCCPSGRVSRPLPDVDIGERDLGRGVEGRHQPGPEVFLEKERNSSCVYMPLKILNLSHSSRNSRLCQERVYLLWDGRCSADHRGHG